MDPSNAANVSPWTGESGDNPATSLQTNDSHLTRRESETANAIRAAVSVACTACRSKHLKCDGQRPCSRCRVEDLECSYVKSRRGWKGPRRKDSGRITPSLGDAPKRPLSTLSPQNGLMTLNNPSIATDTYITSPGARYPLEFLRTTENSGQILLMPPPAAELPMDTSRIGLINAFYTFFFPAHSFVLPRPTMLDTLQKGDLQYLDTALQYIGSFYVVGAPTAALQRVLQESLRSYIGAQTPYLVQASMLLVMGLHMSDLSQESAATMYLTIQTALSLGLNGSSYSTDIGGMNTLFEESLRRTWWELFVWDGILCGVNAEYRLQLGDAALDAPLPVEDADYVAGRLFNMPRTIGDYEEAAFLDDETVFSSATYRIAAVRIIHKVMAATRSNPVDVKALELADTHLTNWTLHLPACKRKVIDRDGNVDEVLFTAHMVIASCAIMLHRPRSDLSHDDVKCVTTCVNGGPLTTISEDTDWHTAKSMRAARDICLLIKMPCPLVKHTPFFTCAIVMSAVVYLSYWSFMATKDGDDLIKEHIKLNIGSLKSYASVMPIAKTVLGQVKAVASDLFRSRKAMSNVYWADISREEMLQNMIEEVSQAQSAMMTTSAPAEWTHELSNTGYGLS